MNTDHPSILGHELSWSQYRVTSQAMSAPSGILKILPSPRQKYQLGGIPDTLIHYKKGKSIADSVNVKSLRPRAAASIQSTGYRLPKYPFPVSPLEPRCSAPQEKAWRYSEITGLQTPFTATGAEAHQEKSTNRMNYVMDCRLIHALLATSLPAGYGCIEAAREWSCIAELRQQSCSIKTKYSCRNTWILKRSMENNSNYIKTKDWF